jgi:hypothetical protein
MKNLWLVVFLSLFVGGCGTASVGSSSTTQNVAMEAGQWELAVVSDNNGSPNMYVDVNLSQTNGAFGGTNAVIFQPSQIGVVAPTLPIYCGDFTIQATFSGSNLAGKFSWGQPAAHFADISGEVAANGQSISNGKYSGDACTVTAGPGVESPQINGTLTGYTVAPVNGTYTGTLTSSLYGQDVVTFTVTQNADYSLNISGTSVENGISSVIVPSTDPLSNMVMGATVYMQGKRTNVNGSDTFYFAGHVNPAATQLTVATMNFGPNETVTGTLTKQ